MFLGELKCSVLLLIFVAVTDAEKEKISDQIIDAMLETDEAPAAEQKSTENPDEKSPENADEKSTGETSVEKTSTETETVTKETDSATEAQAEDVAKEQSSTTADATVTPVVEEGDGDKADVGEVEKSDTASTSGAGDATFKTGGQLIITVLYNFTMCP